MLEPLQAPHLPGRGDRPGAAGHRHLPGAPAQPRVHRQGGHRPRLPVGRPGRLRRGHRLAARGVRGGGHAVRAAGPAHRRAPPGHEDACGATRCRSSTASSTTSTRAACTRSRCRRRTRRSTSGGESDAAMRRVARHGQGWFSFNRLPDDLPEPLARLDAALAAEGRDRSDVVLSVAPTSTPTTPQMVEEYAALGVDRLIVLCLAFDVDTLRQPARRPGPRRARTVTSLTRAAHGVGERELDAREGLGQGPELAGHLGVAGLGGAADERGVAALLLEPVGARRSCCRAGPGWPRRGWAARPCPRSGRAPRCRPS